MAAIQHAGGNFYLRGDACFKSAGAWKLADGHGPERARRMKYMHLFLSLKAYYAEDYFKIPVKIF